MRTVGLLALTALVGCADVPEHASQTRQHDPHTGVLEALTSDDPLPIGAENCAACHTRAYHWWRSTEHVQEDVDCETCHGPGSAHANNPAQAGAIARVPAEATCVPCHGSEAHDFERRRKALLAPGHGGAR